MKTYLSSAIDDHSRFLLHSRFYDNQKEGIVKNTFRQAILEYGKFDACYFDNGSQYIAQQLKLSLSKLGIRIIHAKPRSGKSKGKVLSDGFFLSASFLKFQGNLALFSKKMRIKKFIGTIIGVSNLLGGTSMQDYNEAVRSLREYLSESNCCKAVVMANERLFCHLEAYMADEGADYTPEKADKWFRKHKDQMPSADLAHYRVALTPHMIAGRLSRALIA